ncbi:hypothetical protein [Endozoicomonas sp. 4G]|uniref:cytidine deaminase family protein n=1 Tax=Endozoicomonas sp. 4G TaxID=2872754 RepID=UPI002078A64F|nr:hypothetical protein [Endozoicomonas sp. 4G]
MKNISDFEPLIKLAVSKLQDAVPSNYISYGQVAAVIESMNGNYYSGVCIDTACSMGMCAERNAIGTMLTEGEYQIRRLVCIKSDEIILPCGGMCREFLMQLHHSHNKIEILINRSGNIVTLSELLPA